MKSCILKAHQLYVLKFKILVPVIIQSSGPWGQAWILSAVKSTAHLFIHNIQLWKSLLFTIQLRCDPSIVCSHHSAKITTGQPKSPIARIRAKQVPHPLFHRRTEVFWFDPPNPLEIPNWLHTFPLNLLLPPPPTPLECNCYWPSLKERTISSGNAHWLEHTLLNKMDAKTYQNGSLVLTKIKPEINHRTRDKSIITSVMTVEQIRKSWTYSRCQVAAKTTMIECDGCALWYDW